MMILTSYTQSDLQARLMPYQNAEKIRVDLNKDLNERFSIEIKTISNTLKQLTNKTNGRRG